MNQNALELEGLFEDHSKCSCTFSDSVDFKDVVYEQRASVQLPALRLTNRQRDVQFLLDLTAHSQPKPASTCALQVVDLTQIWSNEMTGIIEYDDLLVVAAIYSAAKVPSQLN